MPRSLESGFIQMGHLSVCGPSDPCAQSDQPQPDDAAGVVYGNSTQASYGAPEHACGHIQEFYRSMLDLKGFADAVRLESLHSTGECQEQCKVAASAHIKVMAVYWQSMSYSMHTRTMSPVLKHKSTITMSPEFICFAMLSSTSTL